MDSKFTPSWEMFPEVGELLAILALLNSGRITLADAQLEIALVLTEYGTRCVEFNRIYHTN